MKVGIDCRFLRSGASGMATYVENLKRQIPELVCVDSEWPSNNFFWNQYQVPLAVIRKALDLYHAPAYTAPLFIPCPLVLTVHDVSYLVRREWYPYRLDWVRRSYYTASIRRADRIIVPSEFSRRELIRLFPETRDRVRCIPQGVAADFQPDEVAGRRVRARYDLPAHFLLHVGDLHTRRNIDRILRAAEELLMPVVLVGRIRLGGEAYSGWPYLFSELSTEDLKGFYNAASLLVYPSSYEGFGLPVLEAMACGLPVVAAKRGSIPEVCGPAAVLVEPEVPQIMEGVRLALAEAAEFSRRGRQRAAEFSWEKTADQTRAVYQEVIRNV